jgi:hypothetical protein
MSSDSIRTNKDIVARVEQLLQAAYEEKGEFNEALNGTLPLEIASLNPDQDPYSLEVSEVLFWTDRDAYNNELAFWETAHTLETHQDSINVLKASDQLPVFGDLVGAIKRSRVAPFIGAGMSSASKFPLWGTALELLIQRIDGIDAAAVRSCIATFDYLKAAQMLWDRDSYQVKNFIRNKFAEGQIENGVVKGPIKLLPRFSHGCLITTNFDPVIEMVIGRGNLEGYMHGTQQGNKFVPKLIKGDRCILKLHGDAEDYDTYIFTESQYTEGYGSPFDFKKPLPRALRQIFVSHSLLFLGCSLEKDRTLDLFQKVIDDKEFEVPDHFAILPEPSGAESKNQKEGRLLALKIRPLWYPSGEHEFVERYLALAVDMAEGRINPF